MSDKKVSLEDIVSLCKRRGFVFQASDIYGGLSGFYDYGPFGVELVNNIKQEWWRAMVHEHDNVYGLDSAIIQNPKLWEASGHVAGFNDPLVDCTNCGGRFRADHLAKTDSTNLKELTKLLKDVKCPTCGKKTLAEPHYYNMMMKTFVGPTSDEEVEEDEIILGKDKNVEQVFEGRNILLYDPEGLAYLRPETAGPMFTNFAKVALDN